ncbi:hypothetical protein CPB85DRAFT_1249583 [Mucidula mucida]|nr:hypothetical protein CPB85DRAFT_1249583 [Mucidula mucida]
MPRLVTKTSLGIAGGAVALFASIRYTNNFEAQYPIHVPPRHSRLWIPNEADPKREIYVADVSPCTLRASPQERVPGALGSKKREICGRVRPYEKGDVLVGGVMEVIVPPSMTEPLMARWKMPPAPVKLFETLAKYGYPWRLMDGGRHDFPVVEDGDQVLVGFSAAHDYAVLDNDGKVTI